MAIITIEYAGIETEVEVKGKVYTVHRRMGYMDEEPGTFVDDVQYTNPATGKPISERLASWVDRHYSDDVVEALCEECARW